MKRESAALILALLSTAGCAGLNRMDRKIDMASEHVTSDNSIYEGTLVSSKRVGALVSMQFVDGQLFEVSKAPVALAPGDIIRIYKIENGYEAHLWKASTEKIVPTPTTHPQ